MKLRTCSQCDYEGPVEWFIGGWCVDCWRAAIKGSATTIGTALATYLLTKVFG